jgi:hypothetical protein
MQLSVHDVEFVKELYCRIRDDDAAIERYRDAIEKLPPIIVARGRILVDGHHRLQAFRREGITTVEVEDSGEPVGRGDFARVDRSQCSARTSAFP